MGMKPKPRFQKGAYLGLRRGLRGVEGTLSPQTTVRTYDGRLLRLDDVLGTGWAVIGLGVDPREVLGQGVESWRAVDAAFATIYRGGERPQGRSGAQVRTTGVVDIEDVTGELSTWLRRAGAKRGSVIALRPDKFVFGISNGRSAELSEALVSQLGLRPLGGPNAVPKPVEPQFRATASVPPQPGRQDSRAAR